MATIKDSGERTEFSTGAVRDMHEGKGRMDLLPWAAIMEVSKHCEAGAKKYGEHNCNLGIPTSSLCDSAARHLAKYLDGWTDEPHLLAACWNLLWALEMVMKHPECVNTPWRNESGQMVLCGECLHHEGDACFHPKQESGWNSEGGEHLLVNATDFCSYGERKNEKT